MGGWGSACVGGQKSQDADKLLVSPCTPKGGSSLEAHLSIGSSGPITPGQEVAEVKDVLCLQLVTRCSGFQAEAP